MTAEALLEVLKGSGLPVVYRQWKQPPELPYLVYLFTYDSDLVADGCNYCPVNNWQVELYSDGKDLASEEAVEAVLRQARIPYDKTETYLDSEDLTQVLYVFRTI